jgi:hypothetical protein
MLNSSVAAKLVKSENELMRNFILISLNKGQKVQDHILAKNYIFRLWNVVWYSNHGKLHKIHSTFLCFKGTMIKNNFKSINSWFVSNKKVCIYWVWFKICADSVVNVCDKWILLLKLIENDELLKVSDVMSCWSNSWGIGTFFSTTLLHKNL